MDRNEINSAMVHHGSPLVCVITESFLSVLNVHLMLRSIANDGAHGLVMPSLASSDYDGGGCAFWRLVTAWVAAAISMQLDLTFVLS